MHTTTTTSAKINAKAHGFKGTLPETFPTPEQLGEMKAEGMKIAETAENILNAGPSGLESRVRLELWRNAEETFLANAGQTWTEYLENGPKQSEEKPKAPKAQQSAESLPIHTMEGEELAKFEAIEKRGYEHLTRDTYNSLLWGACSYRRAGGEPANWAKNLKLSREDYGRFGGLVARIARIVWTMPINELNAGVRAF